jgi:plastocyanin domain-containing protein
MRVASVVVLVFASALGVTACRQEAAPAAPAAAPPVAPPPAPPKAPAAYAPRVDVVVDETGFVPDHIPAKAGKPLTLAITRKTEKTCATEILFTGQEGKTALPLGKTVEVVYTPKASGPLKFGCAMGMMVGGELDVAD